MNTIDYKRFYSEIGKLLYAVADADKIISQAEKKELYRVVRTELVSAGKHTDEFGTDAAHYTEIEFDYLDNEIADGETAIQSFIDFLEDHQKSITRPMREVFFRLAERMANSHYGKNEKERVLLEKLKNKLETLFPGKQKQE